MWGWPNSTVWDHLEVLLGKGNDLPPSRVAEEVVVMDGNGEDVGVDGGFFGVFRAIDPLPPVPDCPSVLALKHSQGRFTVAGNESVGC